MFQLTDEQRRDVTALCRHYGVSRLDLFGSGARSDFDAASSDLDFLVLFQRARDADPVERYFGLLEDLSTLLGRKVDLVDVRAHRNPYFMAEALKRRVMLYAA